MTKAYVVVGNEGFGNSGWLLLGIYPTEQQAQDRVTEAEGDISVSVSYYEVDLAETGSHLMIWLD